MSEDNRLNQEFLKNMDKDKLFETFMMFQNYIQNMNNTTGNNIPKTQTSPIKKDPIPIITPDLQSQILPPNEFTSKLETKSNNTSPNKNFIQTSYEVVTITSTSNDINNKIIPNNQILPEKKEILIEEISNNPQESLEHKEVALKTNDIKKNLNKYKISQNNNTNSSTSIQINDVKKEPINVNSFDDVPIKTTGANFMEILERNLALESKAGSGGQKESEGFESKNKKTRQRFKKVVNVSKPTETKKYKYYSDNFENKEEKEEKEVPANKTEIVEKETRNSIRESLRKQNDSIKPHSKRDSTPSKKINTNNTSNTKESIIKPKKPISLKEPNFAHEKKVDKINLGENSLKKLKNTNTSNYTNISEVKKLSGKLNPADNQAQEDLITEKQANELRRSFKGESIKKNLSNLNELNEKPGNNSGVVNKNLDFKSKQGMLFSIGFTGSSSEKPEDRKPLAKDKSPEHSDEDDDEISTINYNNIDAEFLTHINSEFPKSTNLNNQEGRELLNSKLKELNYEIQKLKNENEKVAKLKIEYEKLTRKLNLELNDINERKQKELSDLEHFKEEEIKKILKERKAFEKMKSQSGPTRKEKEEIESLKANLIKVQEEFKLKDNTNKLMIERLRKQLEEANSKVTDLQAKNNTISNNKENIITTGSNISGSQLRRNQTVDEKQTRREKSKGKLEKKETFKETNYASNQEILKKNNYNLNKFESNFENAINNTKLNNLQNKNNNFTNESNEEEENYDLIFHEKYHKSNNSKLLRSEKTDDGKLIKIFENQKREVLFPSGVRKEIHPDGYQIVYFTNRDIKQIFPGGKSVYYFFDAKTVQTTFPDNLQVFKFESGQIEKHHPDGSKQISFPDGSLRYILPDGYEETYYPDGGSPNNKKSMRN